MSERDHPGPTASESTGLDAGVERYLLDPEAPPAEEVVALERALAPLRYRERPLTPSPRRRARPAVWLAVAAALLALLGGALATWLWSWPAGRAWRVVDGPTATLPVGETLRVDPDESLSVRVARIGWMHVEGASEVRLLSTTSNRHRLAMDEGTLRVGVWAPPLSVGIRTPAGDVIDLGCEFLLETREGSTRVDVVSGWVLLENARGESVVPAGASSAMVASRVPSVPVFRDAEPGFPAAVGALEGGDVSSLATVVDEARARDVLTLLLLSLRRPEVRSPLVERAAELAPPAADRTLARARNGDREAIWAWIDDLPLPPPKRWFPNWRDRWPG